MISRKPLIDAIAFHGSIHGTNTCLTTFTDDLSTIEMACYSVLGKIPKDKGGRKANSSNLNLIIRLIPIYQNGTGKKARVYITSHNKNNFDGDFYYFIIDCLSILNYEMSNIGKTAMKAIKCYKKLLEKFGEKTPYVL